MRGFMVWASLNLEIESATKDDVEKIQTGMRRLKLLCIWWGIKLCFLIYAFAVIFPLYISNILKIGKADIVQNIIVFFMLAFMFLFGAAIWGTLKRKTWGYWFGYIVSMISLLGFPIGTLIGIFGIMSYNRAAVLFGHDGDEKFERIKEAAILNEKRGA
jgi:hypothetical protein